MENKNGVIPPKQKVHDRIYIEHNNFIDHFNNILIDAYYNYFEFFLKKSQNNSRDRIDINKFKDVFNDNSYSFLDLMACFVISCKVQNLSILNFLVSNHKTYGQCNTKKYKISDYKHYYISENNVVKNRQLFTLGFLSLLKDYFKICDKNQEEKDDNEKLLTSLFEDIFLNNSKLINNFKGIRKTTLSAHLPAVEIINNICVKYNGDIKEINETKEKILNYYEGFLLDETISKKDRVKYFVNWCDNELIFNFNKTKIEYDITYDELSSSETMEIELNDMQNQQQFYQNLTNAFNEINEVNHQISSMSFLKK